MCTYQAQCSQSAQKKWRKALYALPALDWHSHDTAESVFWNTELVAQEDKHYYYFDTGIPVISGMYGKHISTGFYGITYIESRRYSCSTETNLGAWVTRFPGRAQLCSSLSSQNKAVPELSHIRHQRDLTNLATEWKLQVSVTTNSRFHCTSHSTGQSTEPQQHCNGSSNTGLAPRGGKGSSPTRQPSWSKGDLWGQGFVNLPFFLKASFEARELLKIFNCES